VDGGLGGGRRIGCGLCEGRWEMERKIGSEGWGVVSVRKEAQGWYDQRKVLLEFGRWVLEVRWGRQRFQSALSKRLGRLVFPS